MLRTLQKIGSTTIPIRNNVRAMSNLNFETLKIEQPVPFVHHVQLNRPDRLNAFSKGLWRDLGNCFAQLNDDADCRVIVLTANGKHFTAGLDFKDAMQMAQQLAEIDDVGRRGHFLNKTISMAQESISSLEKCLKPVIVGVHSACVGAGLNLISTADIRYCSEDAWFTLKEVDIGMAADVGALQRLPKVVGNQSLVREWAFTARRISCDEALSSGLVSKVFKTKDDLIKGCLELAEEISKKSPIAVQATKKNLVYSVDHTVQEGLDQIREINSLNLQSEDFTTGVMAQATKGDPPVFSKL